MFLCHIVGMKPYLIKVLNDALYVPKTVHGLDKPETQLKNDERKAVNQDQRLKNIIISCLLDDVMGSHY